MSEHTFDIVEPKLRAIDVGTGKVVDVDWHMAMDIVHATVTDPECPDRIKQSCHEEMHRLAEAYRLALGWIELLKEQRDEAREAYKDARSALDEIPVYEMQKWPQTEYHSTDDVREVLQFMHQQIEEWFPKLQ